MLVPDDFAAIRRRAQDRHELRRHAATMRSALHLATALEYA